METIQVSKEEMLERVARFSEMKGTRQAFVDSLLPGHVRENFRVIGPGVSENPGDKPAITAQHELNVGGVRAMPGNGAALHAHKTVEIFIPFSGRWAIYWGDSGENEIILGPLDTISVPPGVMRGFRNVGDEEAYLLTIMEGRDAGRVTWSPEILDQAKEEGVALDQKGNLPAGR
ncbi:cupin domain-containing protein [Dehalococcoidia bacterium]|nr:cupin domain-containing protein [Dehalococcoidia bacterium]